MLTTLRLDNFRAFRKLTVDGLTRVSLLVGANNAGKSSVLDAAELLLARHNVAALARSALRRGETSVGVDRHGVNQIQVELRHLFHGHPSKGPAYFRIEADGGRYFNCGFAPMQGKPPSIFQILNEAALNSMLQVENEVISEVENEVISGEKALILPAVDGGVRMDTFTYLVPKPNEDEAVHFVGTETLSPTNLHVLWDRIVLKPEEAQVTETLRIIEPDIERLAALSSARGPAEGRMFVRLKGSDQRIPLGSMGEGIKRLLVLSLNLVSAADKALLVDEIDTGLHHSVMVKMWRLVVEAARRLDVQVLATTHSLDCVHALASLYEEHHEVRDLISLHRIERGAEASVPYSADELLAAARHQMELR